MANILIENNVYIGTSSACIIDLTPPTFAGINFLDVQSRGQIRAGWPVATDSTPPIRYEVYIQASTAVGLFNTLNITAMTDKLQYDIFTLPDGSYLQNGVTYYVGIRAVDAIGNRDSNTVSISVISTGILTSIDVYRTQGAFSINESNQLQGTLWGMKNDELAIAPDAVLGTASYQVFNKAGTAIIGMSQSGITANAEGQYIITPVASSIADNLNHYLVRVTVSIDGEDRESYTPIIPEKPQYNIGGISYLDNTNTVIGSFWVSKDEKVVTTNLGTASYQAYTPDGTAILGLSETGITADVNGIFAITPFALPSPIDPNAAYSVLVTISVDGKTKSDFVVIEANQTLYGVKAQFSINASNQFLATFWAIQGNESVDPTILGTASYQVYDKDGVAVPGLTESGITADSNGLFKNTPVSAALLSDLTHYTVKIDIDVAGSVRTNFKGFTLLGN